MPSATIQIHTFRSNNAEGAKALPDRILVAAWGTTETSRGPVTVNETTLARLPGLQAARKFDRVALDFQHNTLTGTDPVKVAGYGTPRVVAGEGLWLEQIEYTPEGKDVLPGGHYPDISPAVERDASGVVLFLHSAGAVRQGDLDGLVFPFSADFSALPTALPTQKNKMQNPEMTALIALLAALGLDALPENPTAEQIAAAATAAQTKIDAMKKPAKVEVDGFAAAATVRLDKLEADLRSQQIAGLLGAATAQGKVVPFSADMAARMTPAELSAELDKLPPGKVPGVAHDIKAFAASGANDAEGVEIFKSLGLSAEDYAAAAATKTA